ncbi:MAG: hypothetical protein COT84_07330 [Chlamydiae bacterium CG10_big_fil_rev_8_21_14_0_10_35_9]|nr:MAG: hypothetical protein COT84_07330 [Chlamydiae bacterium CG10_big_fil_rev_8_21_14_0_10_35_9]
MIQTIARLNQYQGPQVNKIIQKELTRLVKIESLQEYMRKINCLFSFLDVMCRSHKIGNEHTKKLKKKREIYLFNGVHPAKINSVIAKLKDFPLDHIKKRTNQTTKDYLGFVITQLNEVL